MRRGQVVRTDTLLWSSLVTQTVPLGLTATTPGHPLGQTRGVPVLRRGHRLAGQPLGGDRLGLVAANCTD